MVGILVRSVRVLVLLNIEVNSHRYADILRAHTSNVVIQYVGRVRPLW